MARHHSHDSDVKLDVAGCQVDDLLKVLAREWMADIVWTLARKKVMRFGALRRALPGAISARVLSNRLKELEACALVTRHDAAKMPLHVEYRLTPEGLRVDAALRRSEAFAGELKKRHRSSTNRSSVKRPATVRAR
jgi:DNA-binding HxlR family transcriptional regulator